MKLITHASRIIGTALDDYDGPAIQAPADFDISRIDDYHRRSDSGQRAAPAGRQPACLPGKPGSG